MLLNLNTVGFFFFLVPIVGIQMYRNFDFAKVDVRHVCLAGICCKVSTCTLPLLFLHLPNLHLQQPNEGHYLVSLLVLRYLSSFGDDNYAIDKY